MRRRLFIQKTAGLAAGIGAARSLAGQTAASNSRHPGANDKIRLGLIGCGGMGQGDLECFFLNPEVDCVVVCDVDDAMIAKGVEICEKQRGKKPDTVKDFRRVLDRKDVDVVLIATPDHWHALPTVLRLPGRQGRVCARSRSPRPSTKAAPCWRPPRNVTARRADGLRSGAVQAHRRGGRVHPLRQARQGQPRARLGLPRLAAEHRQAGRLPPRRPASITTCGSAPRPKRPFNPNRFHFNFRWFWDYAGGLMTDWGVHLINIALWAMGGGPDLRERLGRQVRLRRHSRDAGHAVCGERPPWLHDGLGARGVRRARPRGPRAWHRVPWLQRHPGGRPRAAGRSSRRPTGSTRPHARVSSRGLPRSAGAPRTSHLLHVKQLPRLHDEPPSGRTRTWRSATTR